jgi:DNA repair protein RecN (Recombination protein N)
VLLRLTLGEFVIVERAELEFAPGLNALTGETGAGKSILVDAIGLLAGSRGSTEWIRRGAERLLVEGALDLAHAPAAREAASRLGVPLEDGQLLVRREIAADGRSRCFAGGRQVLVSQLRALTAGALWTVGQGEQRVLTDPTEQEELLDRFGGSLELRARYQGTREAFLAALAVCARLAAERESFAGDADFLRAQVREIREADPAPGERARLRAAVARGRARVAEAALAEELEARLFREEGSVLDHLETLVHRLGTADETAWGSLRAELESLRDTVRSLRVPSADDDEEGDLEATEERLRLLERICRRYGSDAGAAATGTSDAAASAGADGAGTHAAGAGVRADGAGTGAAGAGVRADGAGTGADTADVAVAGANAGGDSPGAGTESAAERSVLARLAVLENRLAEGESLNERLTEGEAARESARRDLAAAGGELSRRRAIAAMELAEAAGLELTGLGMPGASLRFAFRSEPDPQGVPAGESGARVRPLENGLERARLMFQSHPAEAEGDIARIASGGELSRVLLALHAALGEASPPGCWILDEVDAGIGGETARRVATRLARMAERAQVLLVTHVPVIAARAARHLCVVKEEILGRPSARVELLTGEVRVRELARMLAGEPDSPTARRHARELLALRGSEER